MKQVRLLVLTEELPRASLALAETESFHPDPRPPAESALANLPGRGYRELYQQARTRLDKIAKLAPLPAEPEIEAVRVVGTEELTELNQWLGEVWAEAFRLEEQLRHLDEAERSIKEQESALANFANLNIDLKMLRTKTRFLDFYVGSVPRENVRQLEGAVGLAKHLLFTYMTIGDHAHVIIVGPTGGKEQAQLGSVLNAAGFQALPIPQSLDSEPKEIQRQLELRRQGLGEERGTLRQRVAAWAQANEARRLEAQRTLVLAEPFVTLDPSIRSAGHLACLCGWVPAREVAGLEARLKDSLALPFQLDARDPRPDERALVPTVAVKSRLLAPFSMLVRQYGIPKYGEVDPTPLFALTFLLMFGAMFGDLGQGAVIAGAAWHYRSKLGRFALFGLLAGASSMVFGLLYGSVFGFEHVLPALWMSPLHDPILMLKIALAWGVLFLTLACLLAIYNRAVVGNWEGALLGHHGVVNLVFYLALIWGGVRLATLGAFGTLPALLVVLALGALAVHSWREQKAPAGEKALVVFIETLETVIGYISNSLSFLRVAAFSLNHVALSIAVFTLAGMMGPMGHWITVVLGNVFILVLEGGIVMIQVLRLEFYEGFARYFSGDGYEFAPLRLRHRVKEGAHPNDPSRLEKTTP
jgi:V/A-type H+-transporting ATPase subunit I